MGKESSMNALSYERIVKDLCDCVGLSDWRQVAASGHIEVAGRTVGLMADDDGSDLFIYIDLGPVFPDRDRALCRSMLIANAQCQTVPAGRFGLHPKSGDAVYHIRLPMPSVTDGSTLASLLVAQIGAAVGWLDEMKVACA
jgi:hypothetical protein